LLLREMRPFQVRGGKGECGRNRPRDQAKTVDRVED